MSKNTLSRKDGVAWSEARATRHDGLIELRRDLHRHPELSMAEHRTAEVIAERLQAAGLEVRTGLETTGAETAVVGVLRGDRPGRVIGWRADIDALPLDEIPDLPFKSAVPGVMHACGHDGHTAIAVTLAEAMAERRKQMPGTAVFLFQPGEEVFGGAAPMIAAGVLDDPQVEAVYGLHLTTQSPAGKVWAHPGPSMASADFFNIEVRGAGGHGAFPHLSRDPITIAAHIVVGLQHLVGREIPAQETAVLTIGQIESGTKNNIIPETATLRGSLRTYDQSVREQLLARLGSFAGAIAEAHRAEAVLGFEEGSTPALVNPADQTAFIRGCLEESMGHEAVETSRPVRASDDMALFLEARPGCYFRVGIGASDGPVAPHHNPNFLMDEAGLPVGLKVALHVMLSALEGGGTG